MVKAIVIRLKRTRQHAAASVACMAACVCAYSTSLHFVHTDCGNKDYHLEAAIRFTEALKRKTNNYSLPITPVNHDVTYWEEAVAHSFMIIQQVNPVNK